MLGVFCDTKYDSLDVLNQCSGDKFDYPAGSLIFP